MHLPYTNVHEADLKKILFDLLTLLFLFFKYIQESAIFINVASIHTETDFFNYVDKFVLIAE